MTGQSASVVGTQGSLCIMNGTGCEFSVYDVSGKLIRRITPADDRENVSLAPAIYIVRGADNTWKVGVR